MALQEIKSNGCYSFYKDFDKGLCLVVLGFVEDKVEGVKIGIGSPENFLMDTAKFLSMLDHNELIFMEILPRFVVKNLKKIFKNNLQ